MAKLTTTWRAFIAMIEGEGSPYGKVVVSEGEPVLAFNAASTSAPPPDIAPLVALLRSDADMPHEVRAWLADALDDAASTRLKLTPGYRTATRQKDRGAEVKRLAAAQYVETRQEAGAVRKVAISDAAAKFKISARTVEKGLLELRAAEEESRRHCE